MPINALHELISHLEFTNKELLCIHIRYVPDWSKNSHQNFYLPTNYTSEQNTKFREDLSFEYDKGYGTQHLFGTIWYKDGTWSDRGGYDGSEWWQYQSCPEIPPELQWLSSTYRTTY